MRKPTDGQIAIGALIAFALWIFVALPLYYGPRDNSAAHKCSAKENENYSFWEKAQCDPVAYFTLWLVGFTGVLAVSTIGLWIVTWRSGVRQSGDMQAALNHARQSLIAIEAAFVTVSDMSITTIGQTGSGIVDYRIQINVINSGRTPARNYVVHCNLVVIDRIPDNFRFADRPHDDLANSVIGPQTHTYMQVDLFIQDALATYQGIKKTLIYGWLEYNDIFPNSIRHRTEFCVMVEVFADPREAPQVIQGRSIPILTVRPYGPYNAHDNDCLYRPGQTPTAGEGELPALTPPPIMQPPTINPAAT